MTPLRVTRYGVAAMLATLLYLGVVAAAMLYLITAFYYSGVR